MPVNRVDNLASTRQQGDLRHWVLAHQAHVEAHEQRRAAVVGSMK
jgi:hypothetical protein